MSSVNKRLSGIELLRIIGMVLVMFGHSHLRLVQMPDSQLIVESPFLSYIDILLRSITTAGVGIFVAISGWFGIRFKKHGIAKYIYMVLFTLWLIYGIVIAFHVAEFNFNGIKMSLSFFEGYWFVIGYLGLYIVSPLLNKFVEFASKKEMQMLLLSYYLFQCYYSWLSGWYDYYAGYSIFLFAGIYLTAAYLRKYPIPWIEKHALSIWVAVVLLTAFIALVTIFYWGNAGRQIRDDNPLVIIASVLLVMCFNKLKFKNVIINWLAASCFTVYLIHYNPFIYPFFMKVMQYVYSSYNGLSYSIMFLFILLLIYLACTLFDQVRIATWNLLNKVL